MINKQTVTALLPSSLYNKCDTAQFDFNTTDELEEISEIFGQSRATNAVQFGIGIQREGYNLFIMGPPGTGKHTLARQFLEQKADQGIIPFDWCYVNNFEQPHIPRALRLPPGQGNVLRHDIEKLIDDLRVAIPASFESEEYRARAHQIEEAFKQKEEEALEKIQEEAGQNDIKLLRTSSGFAFAPTSNGEVISPEEFQQLPDRKKERISAIIAGLQEQLKQIIHTIPQWTKESRERLKDLNTETALSVVGHLIDALKEKYSDLPDVIEHLNKLQQDVITNVDDFRKQEEPELSLLSLGESRTQSFRRYTVNVLVDNGKCSGAPIVYEDQPTYQNLIGRVEHLSQLGALITDFTLIKPGALHRANGGFLILDAHKVLTQPYAWEGLKRALRSNEIRIDSLGQYLGLISTVTLEPDSIPLDIKIVLVGERILYYLLSELDNEFAELFKVVADFDDDIDLSETNIRLYAHFIASLARKEGLQALDRTAVARTIEHSCRITGDAGKLSMHMRSIVDLLRESDYWAKQSGHAITTSEDVQQAINQQIDRHSRARDNVQEEIIRGTLLIATDGRKIAQVNGLSVIALGDFSFAIPTRLTATARVGEGHVIDIEREVELGGPIHSKGVLILTSFIGERYSKNRPLSLHASLVFEQSYGMIEGDSASLAELCCLLSAIAAIPLKQELAITGSVNQHGEIQSIGGVNEKVEGFFDICNQRGLTGSQGVLIPADNVKDLMLRRDVVEAATAGRFHIYPLRTVDEALELLTDVAAGERNEEGIYPEGSINAQVEATLEQMAAIKQSFGESHKEKEDPYED